MGTNRGGGGGGDDEGAGEADDAPTPHRQSRRHCRRKPWLWEAWIRVGAEHLRATKKRQNKKLVRCCVQTKQSINKKKRARVVLTKKLTQALG